MQGRMNVDFIYIVSSSKGDPMCFKDVYVFSWSQGLPVYLGLILDSQPSLVLGLQVYRLTAGAKRSFGFGRTPDFRIGAGYQCDTRSS